jgi:excisionase family DNA binding protein
VSKDRVRKITTDILTLAEVAEMLRVKKMWIYQRTRPKGTRGGIPHYRIGKLLRFDRAEILAWFGTMHRSGNTVGEAFRNIEQAKPRRIH